MKCFLWVTACIIVTLFYCNSCCRYNKNNIFSYNELQDSLEYFVSKVPNFSEHTPAFVCVIFHANSLKEKEDTIVVIMKGNGPFLPVNGQFVVGATYFDKHICEVVYDGFEHLPNIVDEDILTLHPDDYNINDKYDNQQYKGLLYTSGVKMQKKMLTKTYRINRPNKLEQIE